MNQPLIVLIAVLASVPAAIGQDPLPPLRLSPIEIDEVVPDSQADQTAPIDREVTLGGLLFERSRPDQAELEAQRNAETESQILELRKPLSQIRLSGLAPQPSQPPGYLKTVAVSQLGFLGEKTRWITASEIDASSSFSQVTTYVRQPLYFEDAPLERNGVSGGHCTTGIWTNGRSAVKFMFDTAVLPGRMIHVHPDQPVCAVAE
jgi:hypothetical protein